MDAQDSTASPDAMDWTAREVTLGLLALTVRRDRLDRKARQEQQARLDQLALRGAMPTQARLPRLRSA